MTVPVSELLDTGVVLQGGLAEPRVIDLGPLGQRQRRVNYAAKRLVDMVFVTGLPLAEAERRLRTPETLSPGGLQSLGRAEAVPGAFAVTADAGARRISVTWDDPAFGPAVTGQAVAVPGYGGILLGRAAQPSFDAAPVPRAPFDGGRPWPVGDAGGGTGSTAGLDEAADRFLAGSPGLYGVMVATRDGVLVERYGAGGGPAVVTPSWSVTKAITATLIGRLVHEGWLGSIHDPAPAPLWRDPRSIHRLITVDHLLRMRSGLGFPMVDGTETRGGFENGEVYCEGEDAFVAAQRASVLTVPGSVYRYINTGINVLGAIIRDRIEARGLPYHQTVYGLLADRIGMSSYQHSADLAGNFIASGSGFATLRDYARFGVFLLQDGVWAGERLLPEGWVDQVMRPSHTGAAYAASFRSNADAQFPSLPRDAAWATGASGQRVFVLRRHGVVIAVTNETEHAQDLVALDALGAAAMRAAA